MRIEARGVPPQDLTRHIHGLQLELDALEQNTGDQGDPELRKMVAKRRHELHQSLIEYVLARRNGTLKAGNIVYSANKVGGALEKTHAFSMNKITFVLPSSDRSEHGVPFFVGAKLSDLRRADGFPNSLEAFKKIKPLIKASDFIDEPLPQFITRTIDELSEVEKATAAAFRIDPTHSSIAHLRGVAEYLVIGRLLALTQHERVPGLQVHVRRADELITAHVIWKQKALASQYYFVPSPRPAENQRAFARAGISLNA